MPNHPQKAQKCENHGTKSTRKPTVPGQEPTQEGRALSSRELGRQRGACGQMTQISSALCVARNDHTGATDIVLGVADTFEQVANLPLFSCL